MKEDTKEGLIIWNCITNENYLKQIKDVWKLNFFDDTDYQKIYKETKKYFEKYKKLPKDKEILFETSEIKPNDLKEYSYNIEYPKLIDITEEYIKCKSVKQSMWDCCDIIEKGKPYDMILDIIKNGLGISIKDKVKPFGMSFYDFDKLDISENKKLLGSWLKEETITIINAKRGVGKTNFVWGIAKAIGEGSLFGMWQGQGNRVLILDGEMTPYELQLRNKCHKLGKNVSIHSTIYEEDRKNYPGLLLNINYRNVILDYCICNEIKLLILDNKKSLCSGIEENNNNAFDIINDWLIEVRGKGISVILVTHSGKDENRGVRGASSIEDNIDYSITLKDCKKETDYCNISYKFEKVRGLIPFEEIRPRSLEFCPDGNGKYKWVLDNDKQTEIDFIIELHNSGMKQSQISKECGISQGKVSKILNKHKLDEII